MNKSLQYLFVESMGQPVVIDGVRVRQRDSIPIAKGRVTVRFTNGDKEDHGIRLKAAGGYILLSDGTKAEAVDTWRSADLPDEITYTVSCRAGNIAIWNIYRVFHAEGVVTEDMWTGNAGMVLLKDAPNKRVYGCSRGGGAEFDPQALTVEIEWLPES
jgi:hypothetical protein